VTKTASTSNSEAKKFTAARRIAAFTFLVWALGCAEILTVEYAFVCPGTFFSFLFSDEFLLRSHSYLIGSAALATAAATYLVLAREPSRNARWSLFALAVLLISLAFTFRGVHIASAFGVVPTVWSLRFALMKDPLRASAEVRSILAP